MDRGLAIDLMQVYMDGMELVTSAPSNIKTLEEYLPIRIVNCGLE